MNPVKMKQNTSTIFLILFCFLKPNDCLVNTCTARDTSFPTSSDLNSNDHEKNVIRDIFFQQRSIERESRMMNARERIGTERLVNNRRIVDSDSRISNFPARVASDEVNRLSSTFDFSRLSSPSEHKRQVFDSRIRAPPIQSIRMMRDESPRNLRTVSTKRDIEHFTDRTSDSRVRRSTNMARNLNSDFQEFGNSRLFTDSDGTRTSRTRQHKSDSSTLIEHRDSDAKTRRVREVQDSRLSFRTFEEHRESNNRDSKIREQQFERSRERLDQRFTYRTTRIIDRQNFQSPKLHRERREIRNVEENSRMRFARSVELSNAKLNTPIRIIDHYDGNQRQRTSDRDSRIQMLNVRQYERIIGSQRQNLTPDTRLRLFPSDANERSSRRCIEQHVTERLFPNGRINREVRVQDLRQRVITSQRERLGTNDRATRGRQIMNRESRMQQFVTENSRDSISDVNDRSNRQRLRVTEHLPANRRVNQDRQNINCESRVRHVVTQNLRERRSTERLTERQFLNDKVTQNRQILNRESRIRDFSLNANQLTDRRSFVLQRERRATESFSSLTQDRRIMNRESQIRESVNENLQTSRSNMDEQRCYLPENTRNGNQFEQGRRNLNSRTTETKNNLENERRVAELYRMPSNRIERISYSNRIMKPYENSKTTTRNSRERQLQPSLRTTERLYNNGRVVDTRRVNNERENRLANRDSRLSNSERRIVNLSTKDENNNENYSTLSFFGIIEEKSGYTRWSSIFSTAFGVLLFTQMLQNSPNTKHFGLRHLRSFLQKVY